jgi:hypothetical protein
MANIDSFLSKKARPDRVKLFEQASNGKTKEEVREMEMQMLEPEPIPPYTGEEIRYIVNSEHTVKFVFPNQEAMDLFGKHIPITTYIEKSVTDLKIIFDLFRAIDAGTIVYDKKFGHFHFIHPEGAKKDNADETKAEPAAVTPPAGAAVTEHQPERGLQRLFKRRLTA